MPKSIAVTDKHYFQGIGKWNLYMKIPNGKVASSILLMDVLYCHEMCLILIDARFHSDFMSHCRIFDGRDKVIGDILQRMDYIG